MFEHVFLPSRSMLMLLAFLCGFALPEVAAAQARASETYGQLQLHFEANRGQTHEDVRFLARGPGYTLYLTAGEAVLALAGPKPVVLRMTIVDADPKPLVSGLEELPGKANYLIGNDPSKWRTNVPTYAKVHYRSVYPGIDLIYYGNQRQLEYDFVLAPGADPKTIVFGFQGADKLEIDPQGDLVLHAGGGALRQHKPFVYQEIDGMRREIDGGYVLKGANRVGFQVAAYDRSRPLVIDPTLFYSTYLGGSGDEGFNNHGIAVDATGNAYVAGITRSTDFPTTLGAFQPAFAGGGTDAFVTKLNPTGSGLVYSTYLGGSGDDLALGVAIDAAGQAYVSGQTQSPNFPTTPGAFQTTIAGGFDAFVTKLNAAGNGLVYSTYLGGSGGDEQALAITVDTAGSAYVTGHTDSTNFPTTPGAFQTTFGGPNVDAFVTKLNPLGTGLVYSTYLGGSAEDNGFGIAVDTLGNAYVTGVTLSNNFPTTPGAFQTTFTGGGRDGFVTKVNPLGTGLVYSTYLAGSGEDQALGIALNTLGSAYVTGTTSSANFPTTPGVFQPVFAGGFDAFVSALNPAGSGLLYSTYLGGSGQDSGLGIALDTLGNAYVSGFTASANFPTLNAIQGALAGGFDAFVTKVNPLGTGLVWSTYLGGSGGDFGNGIALDALSSPNAYVAGGTASADFPTTPGAFDQSHNGNFDVFVAKITDIGPPATLVLSPAADTNPVGTSHTVTATVTDAAGNPVPDIVVRFTVTGSVSTAGSCTTDANGQCSFTYTGPDLPGSDVITAYADTDADNTQDVGEPTGAATKTWILPVTTPLCEIQISDGGRITALNGDRATFGGNARSSATGQTSGEQMYQDHGPAQPMTVKSLSVLAIVCEGTAQASIYGQATINGAGSFFYRINVKDVGEPGVGRDTYWILLQNGYTSGQQTLEGGNVQIRRTQ